MILYGVGGYNIIILYHISQCINGGGEDYEKNKRLWECSAGIYFQSNENTDGYLHIKNQLLCL